MESLPTTRDGYCRSCDYPLGGVPAHKCPECGRAFDPADASTVSPRPTARRRRWVGRVAVLAGVFVLWCVLGPSRVARFTWTWPNEDGKTATSETRWHLLGPRWLGMTYAKFSTRRWKHPMPGGYLTVADYTVWRVGPVSVHMIETTRADRPPSELPNNFGAMAVSTIYSTPGDREKTWHVVDIRPGNLDTIADLLLVEDENRRRLSWTPHVLKTYPAEAKEK